MILISKLKTVAVFLSILVFMLLMIFPVFSKAPNRTIIDTFETYNNNIFDTWLLRDDPVSDAARIYSIRAENKNKFLHAETTGGSIQIAKKVSWDLKIHPVLYWKWRVNRLPEGANEDARGKNDSAAAIYVVFPRKHIPLVSWKYQPINVIKYVWSTTLPVGQIVQKQKEKLETTIYEGRFIVLRSGKKDAGTWILEKRNVLEDYKKAFGTSPRYTPILVAILTDSNDTKSTASADYDDIIKSDE
jgi:hypothetical protein